MSAGSANVQMSLSFRYSKFQLAFVWNLKPRSKPSKVEMTTAVYILYFIKFYYLNLLRFAVCDNFFLKYHQWIKENTRDLFLVSFLTSAAKIWGIFNLTKNAIKAKIPNLKKNYSTAKKVIAEKSIKLEIFYLLWYIFQHIWSI